MMGSTVSITNRSNHPLHISLKQLTPLYFQNFVQPNETATFEVGKVWFTIEAKVASEHNVYNVLDNVIPITLMTVSAVALPFALIPSSVLLSASAPIAAITATEATHAVTLASRIANGVQMIARTALPFASTNTTTNIIQQLMNKPCVSLHGMYAGSDIRFEIIGGPQLYDVNNFDGTITRKMNEDEINEPFQIKQIL